MKTAAEVLVSYGDKDLTADLLLSIMEEYAQIVSVTFSEWHSGLGYQQYDGVGNWISQQESGNKVFTTKELYKKFLLSL